MSNISLLKAFSILRNGSDYEIGEGFRWKRGVLDLAIGLLVAFPIANTLNALPYRGAIPPQAPLIKSIGNFTGEHTYYSRTSQRYYGIFHAADGKSYRVQDDTLNSSQEIMSKINSGEDFYVEGFLLEDGQGYFWPTFVTAADGRVLLSRDKTNRNLSISRDTFGEKLMWEYVATLPLWIISLLNAIKLKKKLSGAF